LTEITFFLGSSHLELLRGEMDRIDDFVVARAAADIA
jgi:hypothetical protein